MRYQALIFALAVVAISAEAQTPQSATTTGASDSQPPVIPPQTFESNACTQCTFASIPKEPACASLVPVDMQQLQAAFTPTSVNVNGIITAVQNPAIKNCVCHWVTGTFNQTTGGAAATCLTTDPAVPGPVLAAEAAATKEAVAPCNATQAAAAEAKFGMLGALIHCDAVVSHSTGRPPSANPSVGASSSAAASSGLMAGVGVNWLGVLVTFGTFALAVVSAQ
ncbi:hypothetical protein BGX23_007354 [Mortierella sp. AD031]|nr:hypothetical protein BGX23_007354 [Mortierella sp. AD031]